jgi:hypothetical protein
VNKLAIIAIFFLSSIAAFCQSPIPFLERTITIGFKNERLDAALKKISEKGGFTFSYNSSIVQNEKIITKTFDRKTVREILDELFEGTIHYKARGKYIILTRDISSRKEKVYGGYIVDETTGERLKNVSVYDPITLTSAVTDSYGYFEIEIPKPSQELRLVVNKQNYTDTLVNLNPREGRLLNIPLKINKEKLNTFADSVGVKLKRFWQKTKVFTREQVNMANISDSIHRKTQISFVPFIGTNHALSGNVINDYSFNILGGYSLGVRKVEVGGVFNIVRGDVHGFQLAGTFNAIGGNVEGVQLAGAFNANRGSVRGGQLAGLYNFNWGEVSGFSAAGFFNFSRHGSRAAQLAGLSNFTIGDQSSPHFAGLLNFTTGNSKSQLAGIYNFTAKNVDGWQAAGLFNFAGGNVRGAQTAGLFNITGKKLRGAQVSGILNIARSVHGAQIGLINVSDSVGGIPIGLLSVVFKGYHKIEVSADEIFYTNIAFRTGVHQFYNILAAGAKPSTFKNDETMWTFGYGIGTAPKLSNKLFLNFDVTANQIVQGGKIEAVQMLNKLYVGLDYQFARHMSLTFGATLNGYITDNTYEGYWDVNSDYQPKVFFDRDYGNDLNVKMWWGGKLGLRFL